MALSDELLAGKQRLELVRERVKHLVADLGASPSFLVDEAGAPFASIRHFEFTLPHPVADLDELLTALGGESAEEGETPASPYLVTRAGRQAFLVLVVDPPLPKVGRDQFHRTARELSTLLGASL
jgi:hypothetical protein